MRVFLKFCSVGIIVLVVIAALGPAKWTPRTALGWEIAHVLGYCAITSMFCLAWPRLFVIGGALMAFAVLLEGLQAFTPDRSSNLLAALYGAGGVLAAAVLAEGFIRVRRSVPGRWKPTDRPRAICLPFEIFGHFGFVLPKWLRMQLIVV